nr:MAG TPA: hypothetical protein [Caudoviricetes sp.]
MSAELHSALIWTSNSLFAGEVIFIVNSILLKT